MKIMLRVPSYENPYAETWKWLMWLSGLDHEVLTFEIDMPWNKVVYFSSLGPAEALNDITREFLASDCDYLWIIEHDVVPPTNLSIVEELVREDKGYDNLFGWYYSIQSMKMPFPNVYRKLTEDSWVPWYPNTWPEDQDVIQADICSTGCMILRRDFLKKAVAWDSGPWHYERNPDNRALVVTQDVTFCRDNGPVNVYKNYLCGHARKTDLALIMLQVQMALQRQDKSNWNDLTLEQKLWAINRG